MKLQTTAMLFSFAVIKTLHGNKSLLRTCVQIMRNWYALPETISWMQKTEWMAWRHLDFEPWQASHVHTTCAARHEQESERVRSRLTLTVWCNTALLTARKALRS